MKQEVVELQASLFLNFLPQLNVHISFSHEPFYHKSHTFTKNKKKT